MEAAPIRNCLWLVKHGVPFDVAFQLDDLTLAAWCIILAEMEGQVFDWNTMSYKDQK